MTVAVLERSRTKPWDPSASHRASVVIATHNRCALLEKALRRLGSQTIGPEAFEVVVVLDSCSDSTDQMLRDGAWPFELRTITTSCGRASAARNSGADMTRAAVIVFIDDDIMSAPDMLERHLEQHSAREQRVVIGRLAPDPSPRVPGWWRWLEGQLERQYAAMLDGASPVGGHSLYAGNFSISRSLFLKAGGFDVSLPHSEDIELGLRLEREGAPFRFAPEARAEHWGFRDFASWREMAHRYGRWDAFTAIRQLDASTVHRMAAHFHRRSRPASAFMLAAVESPRLLSATNGALRLAGRCAGLVRLRPLERRAYAAIYELTYWKGARDEFGSERVMRELLRREA